MQNSQCTTMNAYVGVTNDVSLAVKSILQVKKAYRTQMKCHEDLTRKNKSIQQRICQLEKRNEDLENKLTKLESDNRTGTQLKCHEELTRKNKSLQQRICQLEKRNKDLENKLTKLESDNQKQEQIVSNLQEQLVSDLIRDTNGVDVFGDMFAVEEQSVCPTSPTNSNKQGSKRKVTPKKKSLPRKSRRLSIRKEKS